MSNLKIEMLIDALKKGDDEKRRYAAEDLGDLKIRESIPFLVEALRDSSVAVQEAVVDSLISIGGKEVCESIISLLDDDDASVRNLAREVFEGMGDVVLEYCDRLYLSTSHDLRKIAIDTLGKIESTKYSKSFATILKALDDTHINVVQAACEALGKLNSEQAVEFLKKHIGRHPWIDATIFLSLGRIGTCEAREILEKIDSDTLSPEAAFALKVALEMV
jgi:HEAT repeat protein